MDVKVKTMRRRYLVIAFDRYYPAGGMGDCQLRFQDKGAAIRYAKGIADVWDYVYVFDILIDRSVWTAPEKDHVGC